MKKGKVTSIYLSPTLERDIDSFLENDNETTYQSRNHFIVCCVMRELRRLNSRDQELLKKFKGRV